MCTILMENMKFNHLGIKTDKRRFCLHFIDLQNSQVKTSKAVVLRIHQTLKEILKAWDTIKH